MPLCSGFGKSVNILISGRKKSIITPITDPFFSSVALLIQPNNELDGSTTFTDLSSNNRVLTTSGNAQIDTDILLFDKPTILFDGDINGQGDYIGMSSSASLNPGTGDFTLEIWMRTTSISSGQWIFATTQSGGMQIVLNGTGSNKLDIGRDGIAWDSSWTYTMPINTMTFFQIIRTGTTIEAFQGNTSLGTRTNGNNYNFTNPTVGGRAGNFSFAGTIGSLRFTNGVARPQAVPTQPFPTS